MSYDNVLYDIFYSYDCFEDLPSNSEIIDKIKGFSKLKDGWDFGQGYAPNEDVILSAIRLYQGGLILGFNVDARPSTEGEIIVSFFFEDNFIDVTVKPDESFDLVYEKGIGANYEIVNQKENVSLDDIATILKNVKAKCFLSELYTSVNMTPTEEDFRVIAFTH